MANTKGPDIQVVESKSGITAWLVESHNLPMISMEVSFRAGSAFEQAEKNGLANITADLLDEGAGDRDMSAFHAALEQIGARLSADAGTLNLDVNLTTLTEHKDDAFALLADALTQPQFAPDAIERQRARIISGIRRIEENPQATARRAFQKAVFEDHPYARPPEGTEATVKDITREDIVNYHKAHFNRANMVVSVVGDISAEELSHKLDTIFADIPPGTDRNEVTLAPAPVTPQIVRIERDIPQSTVLFGHLGISREHPDYFPAFVLNGILGNGGMVSRYMVEVRDKRGLAYHVFSIMQPLPHAGAFMAGVQTSNDSVDEAIRIMKHEIRDIQENGVPSAEHARMLKYLDGSFPLRLDSNQKILGYLSVMQMENLGIDYLDTWRTKVQNVSQADIQRAAKTLLHPDEVVTVIVGNE